ncbi:MAG: hypothetical protein WCB53_03530, partial [Terriglobales bacterium]
KTSKATKTASQLNGQGGRKGRPSYFPFQLFLSPFIQFFQFCSLLCQQLWRVPILNRSGRFPAIPTINP